MSSRYDESSMSSLSANQSAYNAAEPKPMGSASVRSRQSSRAPPPPRNQGGSSVANSYRQPRSIDGRSAQSVASALSHGSAGRGSNHHDIAEDDRSSGTMNLIGQVNDMTMSKMDDSYAGMSGRHSERSRQSRDPDINSVRSGVPPPPPRSVQSDSQGRFDPDGMSHDYGADDPDGLHYAPGINNHMQPSPRGPSSVHSRSRRGDQSTAHSMASSRGSRSYYDEQDGRSYYSESTGSRGSTMMSGPPRLSAEASQFSHGDHDENSYYSKGSRGSRSAVSSKKVSTT